VVGARGRRRCLSRRRGRRRNNARRCAKAAGRCRRGSIIATHPLREGRLLNPELELLDAAGRRAYLDARLCSTARIGLDELGEKPITRKDNLSEMQSEDAPFEPGSEEEDEGP
jgi:hypothetical protein